MNFIAFLVYLNNQKKTGEPAIAAEEEQSTHDNARFVTLSDNNIDQILDAGQAKTTKYTTHYGVNVFKGNI